MCSFRKYPYTPQGRLKKIPGGGGFKSKVSRGVEVQTKKTVCVGYGYFLEQHNAIYMYTSTICWSDLKISLIKTLKVVKKGNHLLYLF